LLERAVGADIHNVDRIVPEYQDLAEGDVVRLAPEDYPVSSPESAPEVARLEPERALVLRPPGDSPAWTWAFVLEPLEEGRRDCSLARGRPRVNRRSDWERRIRDSPRRSSTSAGAGALRHGVEDASGIKHRAERAESAEMSALV